MTNNPSGFLAQESQHYIFLDTEFTSLEATGELLSFGLVPMQDSLPELYVERRDYALDICSPFVRKTVLPFFGRHPESVCPYNQMAHRIHAWAKEIGPGPHTLVCDSEKDVHYIAKLLEGVIPENIFSRPRVLASIAGDLAFEFKRLQYFRDLKLLQHHALYDARALRFAYRTYHALED